jgi:ATP-dependent helicase HrpB
VSLQPLPIDSLLPDVVRSLASSPSLVLEAPPGAGKTTRVPRALLDARSFEGEILVLEPRRLAARLAARRVAEELGERLGQTVGYTVRFEDVSSRQTRVRFVTEGVLTRRLLKDPTLRGVDVVLLDEFHERHLQGDVALALLRRIQRTVRPDLRIVAMSATLEAGPVAEFLACPILRAEGKRFDVTMEHLADADERKLELQVASAVRKLVNDGLDGHVLVFLPGSAEIRRASQACEKLASEHQLALVPLHGDMTPADQDRAVGPSILRKIILSTNLAESSVTIDGVVAVVDSGLVRVVRHAPWSGLPSLAVEKISRASAIQRMGRAGRTRPGRALRLYTKADFDTRNGHDVPEVHRVDLSPTLLELAAVDALNLEWLDAPPSASIAAGKTLLERLGALSAAHEITPIGERMLAFPLHPRLARMLVEAERRGVADDGAIVAALVGEKDLRLANRARFDQRPHAVGNHLDTATEPSDLLALLDAFREAEAQGFAAHALRSIGLDAGAVHAVERARTQLARITRNKDEHRPKSPQESDAALQIAVLAGFPDRVAKRKRQGSRDLALAEGGIAELAETSAVRDAPWLVAVDAEHVRGRPLVRIASAIEPEWLIDLFEARIREVTLAEFDDAKSAVFVTSKMLFDALTITETSRVDRDHPLVAERLYERASAAPFVRDEHLERWLARATFAASQDTSLRAPTESDIQLALREMCHGKTSLKEIVNGDLLGILRQATGSFAKVDELAPERVTLASGRSVTIAYADGKAPWIESYLQDFFGTKTTPRAGRTPLVLHLLAPNKRAVQVTTDLEGFWARHYPAIRKELMRKYPRHAWPEDTSVAVAAKYPRPRNT